MCVHGGTGSLHGKKMMEACVLYLKVHNGKGCVISIRIYGSGITSGRRIRSWMDEFLTEVWLDFRNRYVSGKWCFVRGFQ